MRDFMNRRDINIPITTNPPMNKTLPEILGGALCLLMVSMGLLTGCSDEVKTYHDNGQLQSHYHTVDHDERSKVVMHGDAAEYYADGSLAFEGSFEDGKLRGSARWYRPGGGLTMEADIETEGSADTVVAKSTLYHTNHTPSVEFRTFDGAIDGPYRAWHPNGIQRADITYELNQPVDEARLWHASGFMNRRVNYSGGRLHGPIHTWHSNGARALEGQFSDGRFSGDLKTWTDEGVPELSLHIEDGRLEGEQYIYDDDGHRQFRVAFDGGQPDGPLLVYHDSSEVSGSPQQRLEMHFRDGQLHGPAKMWRIDGQPLIDARYENGELHGPFKVWRSDEEYLHESETPLETEGTFVEGQFDGTFQDYYGDGSPYLIAEFSRGTIDSFQMWNAEGRRLDQSRRWGEARQAAERAGTYPEEVRQDILGSFEGVLDSHLEPIKDLYIQADRDDLDATFGVDDFRDDIPDMDLFDTDHPSSLNLHERDESPLFNHEETL